MSVNRTAIAALLLALAGCGGDDVAEKPKAARDPAVTGALAGQIMVDPDLVAQSGNGSALGGGGPASAQIPAIVRTPEAIAAARDEAVKLAGGRLLALPDPGSGASARAAGPVSLADFAQANGAGDCAAKVGYSAAWAARLPAPFPVYPRANTQEAAGTDEAGCRLRVVNFVTPVGIADVLGFYFTRAKAAGFDAEHRIDGADHVLGGSKGGAAYIVYARSTADGLTDIDLVINGL